MADNNAIIVPIRVDEAGVKTGLASAQQNVAKFGDSMEDTLKQIEKNTGGSMTGLAKFGMVTEGIKNVWGAVSAIVSESFGKFMELSDVLDSTSKRTGMSVESLSALKYVSEQTGVSFETTADAIKTFSEQLGAAKLGDQGAFDKLAAVGIDSSTFIGLTGDEQFLKLADHIAAIQDPAQQTRTAIELFGDAGYALLPMFQKGSAGITQMSAKAKELGLVMNSEAAAAGVKLKRDMTALSASFDQFTGNLVASTAPALTEVFKGLSGLLGVVQKYTGGLADAGAGSVAMADSAKQQTTATDELAAASKGYLDRLSELQAISNKRNLHNEEIVEANTLVNLLTGAYGDLGISVNSTTGEITGLAKAQTEANKAMKAAQIEARKNEIRALQKKKDYLQEQKGNAQAGIGASTSAFFVGMLEASLSFSTEAGGDAMKSYLKNAGAEYDPEIAMVNARISALNDEMNVMTGKATTKKTGTGTGTTIKSPEQLEAESKAAAAKAEAEAAAAAAKAEAEAAQAQRTVTQLESQLYQEGLSAEGKELYDLEKTIADYQRAYYKLHPVGEGQTREEVQDEDYKSFMAAQEQKRKDIKDKYANELAMETDKQASAWKQEDMNAAKARFDSAQSRGTFSAYEVNSVANSNAKQQLETLRKILTELITIAENPDEPVIGE